MNSSGFLGTNASLSADITLVLSILVALLLTIGLVLARLRRYEAHRWVQTSAVVLNIALVLVVMIGSFARSVQPGLPQQISEPYYAVAVGHGLLGVFALLFGTFVMLRGNELVPGFLKFNNYKPFMRTAYGAYIITTLLGIWVYATWYLATPDSAVAVPTQPQAATERLVPMANFVYLPQELIVPVGTTVVWINQDAAPHTATADDGTGFKSELLAKGQQFSFTFSDVGSFPYFCELHGAAGGVDMAGVIKVVPAGEAPPPGAVAQVVLPTAEPTPAPPADLPAQAASQIATLLVDGPGLPSRQGYVVGLRTQADELARHAKFVADTQAAGDLAGLKRHAEHVYNLIAGSLDPNFGDLNGDQRSQNPGDGFGLLPNGTQVGYIQAIDKAAAGALAAPDATGAIKLHAGHVQICATNLRGWASEARDLALQITRASDTAAAAPQVARLLALSQAIQRGEDTNGDGEVAPIPNEGGSLVAYQHAQFMAGLLGAKR